jgi:uncharacterized protein DUF1360
MLSELAKLPELKKPFEAYAPDDDVPLAGYAAAMLTYGAVLGGVLVGLGEKRLKFQPGSMDVVMLGAATHKLARIVTKDFVTAPIRAPFTRRRGKEGAGEVDDQPRGSSQLQASIGYLLTCPYCAGPWLATGLSALLAWRRNQTRLVLRVLTAVTISDFLHLAYSTLNESRKSVHAERRLKEGN